VEQAGEQQQFLLGQVGHQLAAQRELVRVLRHREAAQVAQHEQRMLVDGVDVEQVVLHLSDDAPEHRQVGGQDAVAVHALQLVPDAARLAQDLHEDAAGAQIVAEVVVDPIAVVADQADGRGAYTLQLRVLGEQQKDLQQGERIACEDAFVGHLDEALAGLEALVDRGRFAGIIGVQDGLLEELQQHLVQAVQLEHRAVIVLHEQLDRLVRLPAPRVAEQLGQGALVIEQNAVLAPAGEVVEGEADPPQEGLAAAQRAVLAFGEETVFDQITQGVDAEMAFGHPADHLDVAQAAGALLDVGLEVVGGVVVLVVARDLFLELGLEEAGAGPDAVRPGGLAHGLEQGRRAGEQPRLDEVGRHGDVALAFAHAVVQGAHAVADLQAEIPQQRQEGLEAAGQLGVLAVRQQDEQVDVRMRQQLAAAVAADGNQGQALGIGLQRPVPGAHQQLVEQPGAAVDQPVGRDLPGEMFAQGAGAVAQGRAQRRQQDAAAGQRGVQRGGVAEIVQDGRRRKGGIGIGGGAVRQGHGSSGMWSRDSSGPSVSTS